MVYACAPKARCITAYGLGLGLGLGLIETAISTLQREQHEMCRATLFVVVAALVIMWELQVGMGKPIPTKYLLRANSTLVVSQIKADGSLRATCYVTDNFKKEITQYALPVDIPESSVTAVVPAFGTIASYERVTYCPLHTDFFSFLYVNDTKREVKTTSTNPLSFSSCQQMTMGDLNGDGEDEVALLSFTNATYGELIVFQDVNHSLTTLEVSLRSSNKVQNR